MDFVTKVYDRFNKLLQNRCDLRYDFDFPVLKLTEHDLNIMLIDIDRWKDLQPGDLYLRNFLDLHERERWVILWEDIWMHREAIAESRILAFQGNAHRIHGRKCTAEPLTEEHCAQFLNDNHLMGSTPSKFRFGLFYRNELVSVATFGRSVPATRNNEEVESHELIRFCHKMGYHVSGGLSKLIEHFKRQHNPEDIFTSVDREWSEGSGYAYIGFREISRTKPFCFYIDSDLIRHREDNNGGVRICNAGNIRMALTL